MVTCCSSDVFFTGMWDSKLILFNTLDGTRGRFRVSNVKEFSEVF
jgi:hypothetical protein